MGILWRVLAPKPVKKARRTVSKAAHPVRAASRAVTPRPVKKVQRQVRNVTHPADWAERKAEDAVVNVLHEKPKRNTTRRRTATPVPGRSRSAPNPSRPLRLDAKNDLDTARPVPLRVTPTRRGSALRYEARAAERKARKAEREAQAEARRRERAGPREAQAGASRARRAQLHERRTAQEARQSGVGTTPRAVPSRHRAERRARALKRPWTRDWATWVLILALPAFVTGVMVVPLGPVGIGFGVVLIDGLVFAVPIALIAKLIRWRRRHRSHARGAA
jgi:hypothetical protein